MKSKVFECFLGPVRNALRRSREQPSQPLAQEIITSTSSDKNCEHLIGQPFPLVHETQLFITRTSESIKDERIQKFVDTQQIQVTPQKPTPTVTIPYYTERVISDHLSPSGFSARSSRGESVSSHRSTSRDSSCSKSSTAGDSLSAQLRRARVECHQHPHFFIVPICDQKSLITIDNVEKDIRARDHGTELAEIRRVAKETCLVAPKVFAILACLKKGHEISLLLRDGISDRDLPLRRRRVKEGHVLQRKSGETIKTIESWNDSEIEEFDRIQWWMISPVFKDKAHYELESSTILPFIPFETNSETAEKREGGYSEVYVARIHPSHHNFWASSGPQEVEPLVAIKRLFSSEKMEFDKEVTILKALGSQKEKHPHLITLLATFKHKSKYHLVFPYANANLRKYWKDRPFPSFDEATVLWSLNQMAGIADALESVHNFSVTYPLSVDGSARLHKDAKLCVKKSEELFGRHGDIKPENILWFQEAPETGDKRGVLQLADFGLGRFHGRDSRSKVPWEKIVGGSPTYEPPECKLHRPVSRSYDIWSLGCLYLEFVTWLLKGSAEIAGFSATRGKIDPSTETNDDRFFTIINDREDAIVRKEVIVWVQQLHEHEKCSLLIHDLLDLIMREVLVPDSTMRIPAKWLHHRLCECLQRATADKDYLLKPTARWSQLNGDRRFQSWFPVVNTPKKKRTSMAFMNQETPGKALATHSGFPRDLVGRGAATPGFLKRSKTDGIWPAPGTANG